MYPVQMAGGFYELLKDLKESKWGFHSISEYTMSYFMIF